MRKYNFTAYATRYSQDNNDKPGQITSLSKTWDQIVDMFSTPGIQKDPAKRANEYHFNGYDGSTRRKKPFDTVNLLVLDYDDGMTVAEAIERFSNYKFILYTSYNHLFDKHGNGKIFEKFRIIFPLAKPLINQQYLLKTNALLTFGGNVDPASFHNGQIFLMPLCRSKDAPFQFHSNSGELLDISGFADNNATKGVNTNTHFVGKEADVSGRVIYNDTPLYSAIYGYFTPDSLDGTFVPQVRCPFHHDATPGAYFINFPQRQLFRCNGGCGDFDVVNKNKINSVDPSNIDRHDDNKLLTGVVQQFLADSDSHCVIKSPEGMGKSTTVVQGLLEKKRQVVFLSLSNKQVEEKGETFKQMFPNKKVLTLISQEYQLKKRVVDGEERGWLHTVATTGSVSNRWMQSRTINEAAVWFDLMNIFVNQGFSHRDAENQALVILTETNTHLFDESDLSNDIICMTFARFTMLTNMRKFQWLLNTVVVIDDPSFDDIRVMYNGDVKPEEYRLGYYSQQKTLWLTTEELTTEQIAGYVKHNHRRAAVVRLHDDVKFSSNIVTLELEETKKKYDAILAVACSMFELETNGELTYIADGQQQQWNLTNNKGSNQLKGKKIVVEISEPHPSVINSRLDEWAFLKLVPNAGGKVKTRIKQQYLIDQANQAVGRTLGYREAPTSEVLIIAPTTNNTANILRTGIRYVSTSTDVDISKWVVEKTNSTKRALGPDYKPTVKLPYLALAVIGTTRAQLDLFLDAAMRAGDAARDSVEFMLHLRDCIGHISNVIETGLADYKLITEKLHLDQHPPYVTHLWQVQEQARLIHRCISESLKPTREKTPN